jgi:phage protein U
MYAQLGTIIFEGLNGFDSFDRTRETDFAEHALIDGKPRLQRIGEKLETISISLTLHAAFCNPQEQINALDAARANGVVLPLVNGSGDYLGNYLIKRLGESAQHLATDGKVVWSKVSLDLVEYSDAGGLLKAQKARAGALAVTALGDVPAAIAPLSPVRVTLATPAAAIVQRVQGAKAESDQIDADLKRAGAGGAAAETLYNRTSTRLRAMDVQLSAANAAITKTQNSQTEFAVLQASLTNAQARAQLLKAYVDARDTNNIADANQALQNEMRRTNTASAPLATRIAIRKQ